MGQGAEVTLVVWRSAVHRVVTHMTAPKRWVAWPEGYPDHAAIAWGPEQAIQELGYLLDRTERQSRK